MAREIKFRGLRTDGKGWVYGDLWREPLRFGSECKIYVADGDEEIEDTGWIQVTHASVGQFTGINDKNGAEIYEGDVISYYGSKEGKEIGYSKDGRLVWKVPQGHFTVQVIEIHDEFQMEVIGNIHQEREVNNG